MSRNNQESYVVTKVFDVEYVPLPPQQNDVDNLEFLNHLPSNNVGFNGAVDLFLITTMF